MLHCVKNVRKILTTDLEKDKINLDIKFKDEFLSDDVNVLQYKVQQAELALDLLDHPEKRIRMYETISKRKTKNFVSSEISYIFKHKKNSWKSLVHEYLDDDEYDVCGYVRCAEVDNRISRMFGDRNYFFRICGDYEDDE